MKTVDLRSGLAQERNVHEECGFEKWSSAILVKYIFARINIIEKDRKLIRS